MTGELLRFRDGLATVVDWLPHPEREVVTALFWEQASLRTVAERLGWRLPGGDYDGKKVERVCAVAGARMARLAEVLDELGFDLEAEEDDDDA